MNHVLEELEVSAPPMNLNLLSPRILESRGYQVSKQNMVEPLSTQSLGSKFGV